MRDGSGSRYDIVTLAVAHEMNRSLVIFSLTTPSAGRGFAANLSSAGVRGEKVQEGVCRRCSRRASVMTRVLLRALRDISRSINSRTATGQ